MSADDGVYILVTRGSKKSHGYKKEYRVAHAQAIENIFNPDLAPEPFNTDQVRQIFGPSKVFTDRRIAEGYALRTIEDWPYNEYGIVWLDQFSNIPFPRPRRLRRKRESAPVTAALQPRRHRRRREPVS